MPLQLNVFLKCIYTYIYGIMALMSSHMFLAFNNTQSPCVFKFSYNVTYWWLFWEILFYSTVQCAQFKSWILLLKHAV